MSQINWVYIMTNKRNGTLYVGSTSNLIARVHQHRNAMVEGFTKKYGLTHCVWFEDFPDIDAALAQERRMKRWRREWKINRIEQGNPEWVDLWPKISRL
ncbi:MAG: hypothetical protein COA47_12965 [Robiginitomaculum sp.]|nr:MAG: hypothetical protein COA47_12965 [Robiginitomaculum sp.]